MISCLECVVVYNVHQKRVQNCWKSTQDAKEGDPKSDRSSHFEPFLFVRRHDVQAGWCRVSLCAASQDAHLQRSAPQGQLHVFRTFQWPGAVNQWLPQWEHNVLLNSSVRTITVTVATKQIALFSHLLEIVES